MTSTPNIIFYVSDSLRADHLSCYGYERETSPHIDQLAADGLQFTNLFSQAYKTVESAPSILTGLYPPAHGARTTYDTVPDGAPRIVERLGKQGYTTVGFSTLVQVSSRRAFDTGFDRFDELFRSHKRDDGITDWAAVCTDRVIEWLDQHDERPFFLFIWSNGTHDPYAPREHVFTAQDPDHDIEPSVHSLRAAPPEQSGAVRDMYDDTIRHADAQFGRLVNHLKDIGLYDDTAIVFTADHGEVLSEHARLETAYGPAQALVRRLAPSVVDSQTLFTPGAFVGHLSALPYEELLHVPGIIKLPHGRQAGETRNALAETIDLMPTVADIAGASMDTQGKSLRPLFTTGREFKTYVYSDTGISRGLTQSRSIRSADYKFIRTDWALSRLTRPGVLDIKNTLFSLFEKVMTPSQLLFELPDERMDRSAECPDMRRDLRAELAEWLQKCQTSSFETAQSELDEETRRQLEELGYME